MLPYSRQQVGEEEMRAVRDVLESDWLTSGPAVDRFEDALATMVGARAAVSFCNGTAALHAAMQAIGIQPDDEVIVPALTFVATANCVAYGGGRPVFADVDRETLLIDPNDVESKITPRTRAIVAVDYAGQPCDYPRLRTIADRHGIPLIADACHSIGARLNGEPASRFADLACFSFHPVKPITTAEGGAVVMQGDRYRDALRAFRNHGIDLDFRSRATSGTHRYAMTSLGFNYRLNDIQAAIGEVQLRHLNVWTARRNEIAGWYHGMLEQLALPLTPLLQRPETSSAWHLFVVKCTPGIVDRDEMFRLLREQGIGCNVHYLPVYRHPYYADNPAYQSTRCHEAESAYEQILSLPIFPAMTRSNVEEVGNALSRAIPMASPAQHAA